MKVLRIALILLLSGFTANVYGQGVDGIPGGTILMGGTLGFSSSNESSTITISGHEYPTATGSQFQFSMAPKMGYFFTRNFAAGLSINFSTSSRTTKSEVNPIDSIAASNTESSSQLLAGPFFRYYYFPSNRIGIFGEVEIGLGASSQNTGSGNNSSIGQFSFGIGPGLTFFANDMVAVEALLKYNLLTQNFTLSQSGSNYDASSTINKIDFGIGFQFYFNRVIGGQM